MQHERIGYTLGEVLTYVGIFVVFALVFGFVLGNSVGHTSGMADTETAIHMQAVKRGYGEWVNGPNGPVFKWKGE